MNILLGTCCLTTAIATVSVFSARHAPLQKRVLPWVGGVLLGMGAFWILPEVAEQRGWLLSLIGVSAILFVLALIDRYVYPICPFCVAGAQPDAKIGSVHSCRHTITLGWPLLAVGCVHSFLDGWTIAFSQVASPSHASTALSWSAIVHKVPESVAIGFLAARLTSSRTLALGTVTLIQTALAMGGTLAVFAGNLDARWAEIYSIPACAVLLLFGLLALQEERQFRGSAAAIRAAAPGLVRTCRPSRPDRVTMSRLAAVGNRDDCECHTAEMQPRISPVRDTNETADRATAAGGGLLERCDGHRDGECSDRAGRRQRSGGCVEYQRNRKDPAGAALVEPHFRWLAETAKRQAARVA